MVLKGIKILAVVILVLSLFACAEVKPTPVKSPVNMTILHINDIHGHLEPFEVKRGEPPVGGIARIATLVAETKKENPNTIFVAAGDIIHGTNIANLTEGKAIMDCLKEMGLIATSPGNHEFNFGQAVLKARMNEANIPLLAANIRNKKGEMPDYIRKYMIVNVGGLRIGITGLATTDTYVTTHPKNIQDLDFTDPVKSYESVYSEIKNKIDLMLVLSHLGYQEDRKLAAVAKGIDVIIGGHSHTRVERAEKINNTIVAQAYQYGEVLGRVDLRVEPGKIIYRGYLIPIQAKIAEDAKIKKIVSDYSAMIGKKLDQVIGETLVTLEGERKDVRTRETNLGNLVADVIREATKADIAITNGGGIRTSIQKGPIKIKDIYTVFPFDNYLITLELDGATIKEALELSVSKYPEQLGAFLQVSGISFTFNPAKKANERVVDVKIGDKDLDNGKKYTVATNDFTAAGGDGYSMLKKGKVVYQDMGNFMRDVLVNYIKGKGKISPKEEGRIKIVK